MSTESLWQSYADTTSFPELHHDIEVDVAVIGGGITGITNAQLLKEQGLKVAVLESHRVGVSNTAHSTGNLYEVMGTELIELGKKHGTDVLRDVALSRRDAVSFIEENIRKHQIDCDFMRVPWHYYTTTEEHSEKIEKHLAYSREAGLPIRETQLEHPALRSVRAVMMDNQAQFNPLRYVQALARIIHDENQCLIYENTNVLDVDHSGKSVVLRTEDANITARFVIHATHTPKGVMAYHTLMSPYREYGIAAKIKDPQHPPGIHFGFHGEDHYSTRVYARNGETYLVVVGLPHKVGHDDTHHKMMLLENFAAEKFEIIEFTHRWGGQHYRPADELPYIGRKGLSENVFVATGFSTHGLVYGTLAAQIISEDIMGREHKYARLYSAARFTPVKSAKKFLQENVTVFTAMIGDYLRRNKDSLVAVAPGEGKIIEHEGHKLAVYKDETEGLKVCSAVCTHFGCIVRWNNDERSWDCPCHGSRFDTDGEVLEGPALHALAKADLVDDDMPLRNPIPIIKDNLQTGLGR